MMMEVSETSRIAPGTVEAEMLAALGTALGIELVPRSITLRDGLRVEVEGMGGSADILVQLVANRGTPKSAHRNKLIADMFKLVWLRGQMSHPVRLILCITPPLIRFLTPGSWPRAAATDLGIEIFVLTDDAGAHLLDTATA